MNEIRRVRDALRSGSAMLSDAGVPGAARDARLLLAAVLGVDAGRLTLMQDDTVGSDQVTRFQEKLARRARFQPVSQINGAREFWGRKFQVNGDVLDPRPETETLIERALSGSVPASVLDLGTGSGAILLTLLSEWPETHGLGIDTSSGALDIARANARQLGVAKRVSFQEGDWLDAVPGRYDLVVCNPPYIPSGEIPDLSRDVREWEPHLALTPGASGLESYTAIAPLLGARMSPGGRALFEFGAGQQTAVAEIFVKAGFTEIQLHKDLDGRERVIELTRSNTC